MVKLKLPSVKGVKRWLSGSGGMKLRRVGRALGWTFGVFALMLTFAWMSLPTGAIAWRISHEARKAGFLVTVEDVAVSPFGSVTLKRVTWDFLPSHPEQGSVPFYADAVEVDIEIWKYLLLGRIDADLDFDLEEGDLSANVNRGDDGMDVELSIEKLPLYGVPKFQQMMNAPLEGTFGMELEIEVPNNEFAKAKGFITMSCEGCALGDGETKFYMPGSRGLLEKGITIPKVEFGDIEGRFDVTDGVAKAEEFASVSKDLEIRVSGEMNLDDPFKKSRLDLMLKVLVSDALQKEDANFQLLVSSAREKAAMEPPNEGWLGFVLSGPVAHPKFSGIKSKTKENNLRDQREERRKMLAERKAAAAKRQKNKGKKKAPPKPKKTKKPSAGESVKMQVAPTADTRALPAGPRPAPRPDPTPMPTNPTEGGDGGGEDGGDEEVVEEEPEEDEVVEDEEDEEEGGDEVEEGGGDEEEGGGDEEEGGGDEEGPR